MADETSKMKPPLALRVRFWERAVAFGVDLLAINLVVAVVGLVLVGQRAARCRLRALS